MAASTSCSVVSFSKVCHNILGTTLQAMRSCGLVAVYSNHRIYCYTFLRFSAQRVCQATMSSTHYQKTAAILCHLKSGEDEGHFKRLFHRVRIHLQRSQHASLSPVNPSYSVRTAFTGHPELPDPIPSTLREFRDVQNVPRFRS